MARPTGLRLGIAISHEKAVAVRSGERTGLPYEVALLGDDPNAAIPAALLALKATIEATSGWSTEGARVDVALLPPVADTRLITLPPLSRVEIEAVLNRDVSRYFLGGGGRQVVGFRQPRGPARDDGEGRPVLVAAAGLSVLESIRSTVAAAGWKLESLEAAHGSWLKETRSDGGRANAVVAALGSSIHVMRLAGADPIAVRHLDASDPGLAADALGSDSGRAVLLGPPDVREALERELGHRGWTVAAAASGRKSAEESAAAHAGSGALELVPPAVASERVAGSRRKAVVMMVAAVALLLGAAAAQLWGTYRELDAVRAQRLELIDEITPLLAARDTLNRLTERVSTLDQLKTETVRWVPALVELSVRLPRDTHLTALFASGDTIELEASGSQAGAAIQSLRDSGLLEDVRLDGIVQRELENGETVVERFRVRGRLPSGPAEDGGVR